MSCEDGENQVISLGEKKNNVLSETKIIFQNFIRNEESSAYFT